MRPDSQLREVDAIEFVLTLGRALHRYGTPAHRLEEALLESCQRLGLEVEIFTSPTVLIMSFGQQAELRTRLMRLAPSELDMDKLERVDQLADDVATRAISPADGVDRLEEIIAGAPRYRQRWRVLMYGVTAGALAVFFGGGLADVAVAGAIGLALGVLGLYAKRSTDQARVFELVGAGVASFTAVIVSSQWHATNSSLVTVAALVVLLPGMSLTIAMTELATRHLISGTALLMSAVIVLLELVVGVALGERAAAMLVDVHQAAVVPLPEWARWVALVAASLGMAVVVRAHPRAFGWILAASVIGYLGTAVGAAWLGNDMGAVVGAFALGVLSNVYARWLRRPAQVVQVPAAVLLVPGSMGFRGMASLLGHDTLSGVETMFAMFVVSTTIVAGLLVATAVVSPRRSL